MTNRGLQMKYFNGETELKPQSVDYRGSKQLTGEPLDFVSTYDRDNLRWNHNYVPVTRKVRYNPFGTKHECDARCMNAKGRNMNWVNALAAARTTVKVRASNVRNISRL
jgi:hypothetical protein